MADATATEGETSPKPSKMPLVIGLVLAVVGGAGGFFATSKGLILAPESSGKEAVSEKEDTKESSSDFSFVPMDPLTISMPRSSPYSHLRFRGELEVSKKYQSEVEAVKPRIIDVLNSYLRALEVSDIEQPSSLTRLRSQMLRRVQIVAGPGRVTDLLIMEFVLN